MQSRREEMDGETKQVGKTKEKEGRSGKNKDISRYGDIMYSSAIIWLVDFVSDFYIDNAYSCDPRVKWFKEQEKAEKEAKKRAKREAARQEAMERERVRCEREYIG